MHKLLQHVCEPCDDPDCEIHRIEVGLSEGTVTPLQLAFFIAGAQAMEVATRRKFREVRARKEYATEEPTRQLVRACLEAGSPILELGIDRLGS